MHLEEITADRFNDFARGHMLKNFFQSREYGELMAYSDYKVIYIGAFKNAEIIAGSLILYKNIAAKIKYGYAPRGFLIDYYNKPLLKEFTKKVKEFFLVKGFAFIKINPEVTYAILDYEKKTKNINANTTELISYMKELGYNKLKDNLYFESLLPKFTPVIYLSNYKFDNLDESIIKETELATKKGIRLVSGSYNDIEHFYKFINDKNSKTLQYYQYFYENFINSNMVDLILVEVNYDLYIKYLQKEYIYEQDLNSKINSAYNNNINDSDLYEKKMASDKILNDISSTLSVATTRMGENVNKEYIGGAFVVKNEGRVTIIITGQNELYKELDIKTFLFYKIIEEYKKAGYNYLDLFGITGDFSDNNPYKELNKFKLKYNPTVYEYIGEFDLIINKTLHQILWSTNKIQKEFYRPSIKK